MDRQGKGGYSYVRKLDVLTGSLVWEMRYPCFYDGQTNGGMLASPVVGKNDIKDLIVYNVTKTGIKSHNGKLVALSKTTGKEVWSITLSNYCWSSPVDIYTKCGVSYLVVCDSIGNMFLIKGTTGEILDTLSLSVRLVSKGGQKHLIFDCIYVLTTLLQFFIFIQLHDTHLIDLSTFSCYAQHHSFWLQHLQVV